MKFCENCGAKLDDNDVFCPECGSRQGEGLQFCEQCGAAIEPGDLFCPECGAEVGAMSVPVAVGTVHESIMLRMTEKEPIKEKSPKGKTEQRANRKRTVWVWAFCGMAAICLGIFAGSHLMGGTPAENTPPATSILGVVLPTEAITEEAESPEPETTGTPSPEQSDTPDIQDEQSTPIPTPESGVSTEPELEQPNIMIPDKTTAIGLLYDHTYSSGDMLHLRVPFINCDTPDAERLNLQIMEDFGFVIERCFQDLNEGFSSWSPDVDFYTIWWGDSLTLIVYVSYLSGNTDYGVYRINRITGCEISNQEILEEAGLTEEEFIRQARAKALDYFNLNTEWWLSNAEEAEREIAYETLEDYNDYYINIEMPIFFDEQGQLNMITTIPSFAGADYYETIIVVTE